MTKEDKRQNAAHAASDLEDIDRLRSFGPFTRYFMRKLTAKIESQKTKILTTDCDEKLEKRILKELDDIAKMLDRDEAASRNIIESASL